MSDLAYPPFRMKMVEPIRPTTRTERAQALERAHYNLFNVPSELVTVDLLTDSGTGGMSQDQWAALLRGDEAYAGSRSFARFQETVREIFGYTHVLPTHQCRAAENLFFGTVLTPGQAVLNNTHFDTTRANIAHHGGDPIDCAVPCAAKPQKDCPFKGKIDLDRLETLLRSKGRAGVALVMLTLTNNSCGGQPVSMENIRATSALCRRHGVPLYFDACRFAENAWFIREREEGYADKSLAAIAREMFSYGDGCTMSAKKDALVNMGGFFATNDAALARRMTVELIRVEGFPTYGGLAGRDLDAIAVGLREALDPAYMGYRVGQIRRFGERLTAAGVPIFQPVGGHAVYLDAGALLPHIPPHQFPGQALSCTLYREGGIRSVEVGSLMAGPDVTPPLELVRLTVPHRLYTDAHLEHAAAVAAGVAAGKETLRGLRLVEAPEVLRHFSAHLTPLDS